MASQVALFCMTLLFIGMILTFTKEVIPKAATVISVFMTVYTIPCYSNVMLVLHFIYKRLYCYLIKNILVKEQFGFREKLSMEMATYTLLNNVLSSFDLKKIYIFLVYSELRSNLRRVQTYSSSGYMQYPSVLLGIRRI